ncbi:MAG: hypothetical protein AB4911_00220 [Oscillochloridaceae bacterium umkhey_bin13]
MSMRRVESFLLRIVVPEDTVLSPEHWRGRIQHVASGAELQIDELAQAVIFISSHLTPLEDLEALLEPQSQPTGPRE